MTRRSSAVALMSRKQPSPSKRETQPDIRRPSGPASKGKRARSELPTEPPPKSKRSKAADAKTSGTRSRRPSPKGNVAGAAVDEEVTADLSKDLRREPDDD